MLGNNQFFILGSNSGDINHTNAIIDQLNQSEIPFHLVIGNCKGERENSFIVHAKHETKLIKIAKEFSQNSILFVDAKNNASLISIDNNNVRKLGKFQLIKFAKIALNQIDYYTYDPVLNQYWTTSNQLNNTISN